MGGSASAPETQETPQTRRRFRHITVGQLYADDTHPSVQVASCLTIALERATQRAERAEAEVLALLGDKAKPSALEEVDCSICCQKLQTDRRKKRNNFHAVQLLQCRHVFHHAPCPICRSLDAANFTIIDGIRGPRLPLPSCDQPRQREWIMCLGECRSRPWLEAALSFYFRTKLRQEPERPLDHFAITHQIQKKCRRQ